MNTCRAALQSGFLRSVLLAKKTPTTVIRFLIIRMSSIGDIVLTTPVVRGIKQQMDGAEIYFLVKKQFAEVVLHNPYIDHVLIYDNNLPRLLEQLQALSLDYIIDLHHNMRSARIKSRLKVAAFSFNKLNIEKWLLVNFNINRLPDKHIVQRYMETVHVFDVRDDGKGLDFFIPETSRIDLTNLLEIPDIFPVYYVAFVIGAKHFTKQLPAQKIIRIARLMQLPLMLLGGNDDQPKAKQIAQAVENEPFPVFDACGRFSLGQSASLLQQAALVITHDTGLMHIAAAFGQRIISVWGNTVPAFGMTPFGAHAESEIVEVSGLKCRPCSKIGFAKCPKNHFKCMELIDEQRIANKAQAWFEQEASAL